VAAGILPAVEPGFQPGGKNADNTATVTNSKAVAVSSESPGGKMPPSTAGGTPAATFPGLLTYFRQGKLDKFFLGGTGNHPTTELDFMSAAAILKPADPKEARQAIPREFYDLLDKNKAAFVTATTADAEAAESTHRGSPSDAYIMKRLKDKAVRRCPQFTEDDEEFVGKVIRLLEEGALPKPTSKKVAAALKKPENLLPLKVLAVLRRDIKWEYFQASPAAHASQALAPREVILSSWLVNSTA
jgi:hypothetical protein